eukprot:403367372
MRFTKTLLVFTVLGMITVSCQDSSGGVGAADSSGVVTSESSAGSFSGSSSDGSQEISGGGSSSSSTSGGGSSGGESGAPDSGPSEVIIPVIPTPADNTTESGGEGGQVTNITFSGETYIQALGQLVNAINGSQIPVGAAALLVNEVKNFKQIDYSDLQDFASLALNNELSSAQKDIILEYFNNLTIVENRAFGSLDSSLASVFRSENEDQCYTYFSTSLNSFYVGWYKFKEQITGSQFLSAIEQTQDFAEFCKAENNFNQYVDNLANLLLGQDECDVLQSLYGGSQDANIYVGWRDFIADKAAFLLYNLEQGIVIANACEQIQNQNSSSSSDNNTDNGQNNNNSTDNSTEGGNNTSSDNSTNGQDIIQVSQSDKYEQIRQSVMDRILMFDQLALQSVEQTLYQNLRFLLRNNQGNSLEVMAININGFALSQIYSDYLLKMLALSSKVSISDLYVECWNCISMMEGQYLVVVDWLPVNSTASLPPGALDNIVIVRGNSSDSTVGLVQVVDEQLSSDIWETLGNCTSGISWVDKNVDFYINNNQGNRVVTRSSDILDMWAWGIQEFCYGRPSSALV